MARINPGGTLGPWVATTSLPSAREHHASVLHRGFLYVLGGSDGTAQLNDVQVAPVNPDGGLGAWTATNGFTRARSGHTSVVYNGSLYVLGGTGGVGPYFDDVQFAPLKANGTVGDWTATTSLPAGRAFHSSVAYNGSLYVLGGAGADGGLDDVQAAPFNPDGTLGPWTPSNSFAIGRERHASVMNKGTLYVIGGLGAGGALADVQVAPFEGQAAIGTYSRLIDLGGPGPVGQLTVNGSAANRGVVNLAWRSAPDSGVFGPTVSRADIPLGVPLDLGVTDARYLWVKLTLDDTGAVTASTSPSNQRDVTDLTLSYPGRLGGTCTSATECASGQCVDGVCCNSACAGPCDACNLAGAVGMCSNAPAGSPGTPSCAPAVCSGTSAGCPIKTCGCSTAAAGPAALLLLALWALVRAARSPCRRGFLQ